MGDGDDLGSVPLYIRDLFVQPTLPLRYQYLVLNGYNSEANLGWNGPYLQHSGARYKVDTLNNFTPDYGTDLDPAIKDSWGHPLVLQWPTFSGLTDNQQALTAKWRYGRVVSAGPNGKIDTPLTSTVSNASSDLDFYPSMAECGDDLVLFINAPDRRQ